MKKLFFVLFLVLFGCQKEEMKKEGASDKSTFVFSVVGGSNLNRWVSFETDGEILEQSLATKAEYLKVNLSKGERVTVKTFFTNMYSSNGNGALYGGTIITVKKDGKTIEKKMGTAETNNLTYIAQ